MTKILTFSIYAIHIPKIEYMTHSQMLGKVESGGGPIFKVVLESESCTKNIMFSPSPIFQFVLL